MDICDITNALTRVKLFIHFIVDTLCCKQCVVLCCAVPCRAVLCCAVPCCALLCCAVHCAVCYAVCCIALRCAVLCCAMLYCAVLCLSVTLSSAYLINRKASYKNVVYRCHWFLPGIVVPIGFKLQMTQSSWNYFKKLWSESSLI